MAGRKGSGFSEEKAAYRDKDGGKKRAGQSSRQRAEPERRVIKIGPGGRVVIPADFRKTMEVQEGDNLVALLEDGELRLIGHNVAVRKVQAYMRSIVPEEVSLVDELIEDRKREFEDEERDD